MRKSRGSRIDACGTPLDSHAGRENAFSRLTKNVIFLLLVTFATYLKKILSKVTFVVG